MKTVFVNPERCVGCKQCELACTVEHSQTKNIYTAIAEDPPPRRRIHVERGVHLNSSFPNKCRHCDPAPCMRVCPTGAIAKKNDYDTVDIDKEKCMTCGSCAMVCPYDVLTYHVLPGSFKNKTVAVKCDNCLSRLQEGQEPACVETCKTNALVYGEINDLIKQARTSMAEKVTVALAGDAEAQAAMPDNVAAWKQLGVNTSMTGKEEENL